MPHLFLNDLEIRIMASVRHDGIAWEVTLSHNECDNLANTLAVVSAEASPEVATALEVVSEVIRSVDSYGGNQGVAITVIAGVACFVTPPDKSPYRTIVEVEDEVKDFVHRQWGTIITAMEHVLAGTSDTIRRGVKYLHDHLFGGGRQDGDGEPMPFCDQDFPNGIRTDHLLVSLPHGKVGILTAWGWLQATDGGGQNKKVRLQAREDAGAWESWDLDAWSDGTVSLKAANGNTLMGISNDLYVWADVPVPHPFNAPPPPSKIQIEHGDNGRVRLFSWSHRKYMQIIPPG
jgi:hypothetical protein